MSEEPKTEQEDPRRTNPPYPNWNNGILSLQYQAIRYVDPHTKAQRTLSHFEWRMTCIGYLMGFASEAEMASVMVFILECEKDEGHLYWRETVESLYELRFEWIRFIQNLVEEGTPDEWR